MYEGCFGLMVFSFMFFLNLDVNLFFKFRNGFFYNDVKKKLYYYFFCIFFEGIVKKLFFVSFGLM